MASRFAAAVSDADELSVQASAVPSNTKSMTEWGIHVWSEWANSRTVMPAPDGVVSVGTPLMTMTPVDLAYWMGKFVLEVRKKDGQEYPPKTLYALVCCFKRFFEQNGVFSVNPLNPADPTFGSFRVTLDAEMKRLHGLGLGTSSKQAEPIHS